MTLLFWKQTSLEFDDFSILANHDEMQNTHSRQL